MRNPKGKLVALLAGAVAVPLLTLAAVFWKDVYCHLFLDPRLAGQWTSQAREVRIVIKFDRIGNMRTNLVAPPEIRLRIDGGPVASSHLPAGCPVAAGLSHTPRVRCPHGQARRIHGCDFAGDLSSSSCTGDQGSPVLPRSDGWP